MIVYTSLGSAVNLTVKFHIHPVNNYDVYWSLGGSVLQNNVRDRVIMEHVKTTYFISNVTDEQLGSYGVRVINWACGNESNEVTFKVILKSRGEEFGT